MPEAQRLQGVQQDDVQVAGDAAVLEASSRRIARQWNWLTACRAAATRSGFCKWWTPGNRAASSRASSFRPSSSPGRAWYPRLITATGISAVTEPLGEPIDQGRFAGAAQGEVAHADDRHVEAMDGGRAAVIAAIAPRMAQA